MPLLMAALPRPDLNVWPSHARAVAVCLIMTQSLYYCVMLYATPEISVEDARVLAAIDVMRQELRHAIRDTPVKWTDGRREFLTAHAIAASNSIEGFKVSTVDVVDLIEGEHDIDISEENLAETVAY